MWGDHINRNEPLGWQQEVTFLRASPDPLQRAWRRFQHCSSLRLAPSEPSWFSSAAEPAWLVLQENPSTFNRPRGISSNSSRCCQLMWVGTELYHRPILLQLQFSLWSSWAHLLFVFQCQVWEGGEVGEAGGCVSDLSLLHCHISAQPTLPATLFSWEGLS